MRICRWQFSWGQFSRREFFRGQFSGGQFSVGQFSLSLDFYSDGLLDTDFKEVPAFYKKTKAFG